MYSPIYPPRHETLQLRDRQTRLLHWGETGAPQLVLLHGWMDCASTFQFIADTLARDWHLIAMDWRGFGDSQWNHGRYYFPDYLADLDALLSHLSPDQPVRLAGHSMGAMVAGIYAGVRPERVKRLSLIEGFGLNNSHPDEAPARYARWLREQRQAPAFESLTSRAFVAGKLLERNPRMEQDRADFMACALTSQRDGQLHYRADPGHKGVNPVLYRLEEAKACWRRIRCPVQWVIGGNMWDHPMAKGVFETLDERRACFARLEEIRIPDAGHMVQWEQPERLAQALQLFFHPLRT